ncbi:NAD(P)/FAD-dependent oxidoreductase [Massilia terrae]|uniref:NAD(P)-binding protein n=1 Tax=Massilia terrae TaxID=1811224 RepID=A0ABT2CZ38_9BURK|nr:NAD(P)/FAD-dependent oxidoreductase [Massilia terrae]MCS0659246.1 NAD(P)-binding protein [Massilia terrae]
MDRRSFLAWGGAAGLSALGGAAVYSRWQEIGSTVNYVGRAEGHYLRDRRALPPPGATVQTDVLILGSGIGGLSAAWKLNREGHGDFLMIDGPQPFGNAAGGHFGDYAYPTGAHYLPLPSAESVHVREILADLGIIQRDPFGEKPYYDERFILHAPEERLLLNGRWQDGFVPFDGVPAWELAEHKRFFAEVERLRKLKGSDGRRIFVFPTVLSSTDPAWQELDKITLSQWLEREGYKSPTLHWYLNYCCRDDYGTRYDKVSAWAGLHYYCSRWGQAANSGNGAWLTWPGGLSPLAEAMAQRSAAKRKAGTAVSLKRTADGVEAMCFTLEDGVAKTFVAKARKAICAMPLYVASRVVERIGDYGFDPKRHMPSYAPWMIANFLMKDFPAERPNMPLCWDNVVYDEPGLGYVVSTHQDIRVAPPEKTVFTSYVALSDRTPDEARKWLMKASADELVAVASRDLKTAYGWKFAPCVERVDITLRGHAMAAPLPGFRTNAGLLALRDADGPILFAHADLSGFSVFEEAAWWGIQAAQRAMT